MTAAIQSLAGGRHSRVYGVGAHWPSRVVTNDEVCALIDSSDEWIRERSGIVTRRWAAGDESVVDMAVAAGGKALAHAGVAADQIGLVLVPTVTHPYQTPAAAADVAYRLGALRAAAVDISAACAGFCYGVAMASDAVRCRSADYVLVIGVEKLTDFVDKTDRATAFLFADGAGAAVVGPAETPGIGPVAWGADGSQLDAIEQSPSWAELREDRTLRWPALAMKGQQVFRWAAWQMAPVANRALELAGITVADLDAFIPHQANMRITDTMIKALKLPPGVPVARDIVDSGNTSAASIPLAMSRMLESGEVKSGGTALLIGFGAGLVYAAQVITLP